jgi:hypothetical protein
VGLAVGALLPVTLAAAFFAHHGAPLLPASVLLKRTHASLGAMPALLAARWIQNPHVPGLLFAMGAAWVRSPRGSAARPWLAVGAAALIGQSTLAQLGWLYRYESYAIAVSAVGLALALARPAAPAPIAPPAPTAKRPSARRDRARSWAPALAFALALLPAGLRAVHAHAAIPQASRNVAEQQLAIARFVRELPRGRAVAVNDVGAIAYVGQAPVLDLLGLADLRIARARGMRIDAPLSRADVERFTREAGVELAVLYEPWFEGAIPASWVPLERWRIRDNRVCAFDTVTFFATGPEAAPGLRRALDAYRPRLPKRVDALPLSPAPSR